MSWFYLDSENASDTGADNPFWRKNRLHFPPLSLEACKLVLDLSLEEYLLFLTLLWLKVLLMCCRIIKLLLIFKNTIILIIDIYYYFSRFTMFVITASENLALFFSSDVVIKGYRKIIAKNV